MIRYPIGTQKILPFDTGKTHQRRGGTRVSQKTIRVCDGCGKELTRTQDIFHLNLRTDRFYNGVDSDYFEKELDFCERCANSIKQTLEKIAERGQANEN